MGSTDAHMQPHTSPNVPQVLVKPDLSTDNKSNPSKAHKNVPEADAVEPSSRLGAFFDSWPTLSRVISQSNPHSHSPTPSPPPSPIRTPVNEEYRNLESDPISLSGKQLDSNGNKLNSIGVGRKVNNLLEHDDVKEAVATLNNAVAYMSMSDTVSNENPEQVAKIYSEMLHTLCEPKILNIVNEISGVDLKKFPQDITRCIMWRLFIKVVQAGYTLEKASYLEVIYQIMHYGLYKLAIKALYSMPRRLWDTDTYKLAITLHLMQTPRQIEQAEWLLTDYGKAYLDLADPKSPASDSPLIRIDTPLMKKVTDQDKFNMWIFYQARLGESDWIKERSVWQSSRENMVPRPKSLAEWVTKRLESDTSKRTKEECENINENNTAIFVSMGNQQYEYGWQIYQSMGELLNKFTPRVIMHLCWRAHKDTPLSKKARRSAWETRAWELYSRFMCSVYLTAHQPEMPGFLGDLLSISATSPEREEDSRFAKTMQVYYLLEHNNLKHLLCNEQVLTPILCTILHECHGPPSTIMKMCRKAFNIWYTKQKLDTQNHIEVPESFSIDWALLVLCLKSGDIHDFLDVLEHICRVHRTLPSSLLAPIQRFHDMYLNCDARPGEQPIICCYFDHYLFRKIQYTDDPTQTISMDELGFIEENDSGDNSRDTDTSEGTEPMAYLYHALHRRTNIKDFQAASLAMAVSMGIAQDEILTKKKMYCSAKKVYALIQHCLKVSRARLRNKTE
ncbi:hypothetical protein F4703DRAFT_1957486 [Phycomyces blakesleeanus]